MYSWIWRHLPGPRWLKVLEALLLIAIVVIFIFLWGFDWFVHTFNVGDTTVN